MNDLQYTIFKNGSCKIFSPDQSERTIVRFEVLTEIINTILSEKKLIYQLTIEGVIFSDSVLLRELRDIELLIFSNCEVELIQYSFSGFQMLKLDNCTFNTFSCHAVSEAGDIYIQNCTLTSHGSIDIRHPSLSGHLSIENLSCDNGNCELSILGGNIVGFVTLSNISALQRVSLKNLTSDQLTIQSVSCSQDIGCALSVTQCNTIRNIDIRSCSIIGQFKVEKCAIGGDLLLRSTTLVRQSDRITGIITSCDIAHSIKIVDIKSLSLFRIEDSNIGRNITISSSHFSCGQDNLKLNVNFYNGISILNSIIDRNIDISNCSFFGGMAAHGTSCNRCIFMNNSFSNGVLEPKVKLNILYKFLRIFLSTIFGMHYAHSLGFRPFRSSDYQISFSGMKIDTELVIYNVMVTDYSIPYFKILGTETNVANDSNFIFPKIRDYNLELEGYRFSSIHNNQDYSKIRTRIRKMKSHGVRGDYLPMSPDPFFQLAAVLNQTGDRELADHAQTMGLRAITRNTRNPITRVFRNLVDLLFGYGLSRTRASLTLAAWVTLGTIGTSLALERDVFVIDTLRVAASSIADGSGTFTPATTIVDSSSGRNDEFQCNGQMSAVFYAIESIIPIIEFGQVKQCIIRLSEGDIGPKSNELDLWWSAKIAYTIIGWIMISIVIITFSGVVRNRD